MPMAASSLAFAAKASRLDANRLSERDTPKPIA